MCLAHPFSPLFPRFYVSLSSHECRSPPSPEGGISVVEQVPASTRLPPDAQVVPDSLYEPRTPSRNLRRLYTPDPTQIPLRYPW